MTTIRVTFADGHTIDTSINGTPAELRRMSWPHMSNRHGEVVRIDCLDPISGTPCVNGRIA